jgi:hypothetical protein
MVPQEAESRASQPVAERNSPAESRAQRMAPLRLRANQLVADSSADALEAA